MQEDTVFSKSAPMCAKAAPALQPVPGGDEAHAFGLGALVPAFEVVPVAEPGLPARARARLQALLGEGALARAVGEEARDGHAFLFAPVALGAGAALWFSLAVEPVRGAVIALFLLLCGLGVLARNSAGPARLFGIGALLFSGGMLLADIETARRATVMLDRPVTTEISGWVERRERDAAGRWRYLLRLEETRQPTLSRAPQRVMLTVRSGHAPFTAGERLSGKARLSPPSGPALPGLNDFAFDAYFDGIGAQGFLYGTPQRGGSAPVTAGWLERIQIGLFDLRGRIGDYIRARVPGDAGAFAAAIVTDERRAISEATTEALRLSGLAHIVAISGLNMALAAGIFFVGLRMALALFTGFAQAVAIKKIAAAGALVMATAYYLISGFAVSAERAYIMMAVMLVAAIVGRPSISLRNVALSALIMIVLAPSEILGPSFQMSFAATVALISGYRLWQDRQERRVQARLFPRHPAFVAARAAWQFSAGIFFTSLIGGVSTAMFSLEHFHRVTTWGLVANLAAMPVISFVVMPAGLAGMLLMPFGLDAPFLKLMGAGLEIVIDIAHRVGSWGGDARMGRQDGMFLPLACLGFILLTLLRSRLRLFGLLPLALSMLIVLRGPGPPANLLISEDGVTVALFESGRLAINRSRPPGFIWNQWQRALLLPEPSKPLTAAAPAGTEDAGDARAARLSEVQISKARMHIASAAGGRFSCLRGTFCAVRSEAGIIVAVVEDGRYAGAACDAADIVIAARARFASCNSAALLINGEALRRSGALEISFNASEDPRQWRLRAAMAGQERAWTRHRHYDWRSRAFNADPSGDIGWLLNDSGG